MIDNYGHWWCGNMPMVDRVEQSLILGKTNTCILFLISECFLSAARRTTKTKRRLRKIDGKVQK